MMYRLPEMEDKALLDAYVQEHFRCGEKSISASMGLAGAAYPSWVEKMHQNATEGDARWGKSLLYLCLKEGKLVGLISIRYQLPSSLAEQYGHIGYGVRPWERNKGYATEMLNYALAVCREKGLKRVMLGCFKENIASAKTIRKNGGVLVKENENYQCGNVSQYYEISL